MIKVLILSLMLAGCSKKAPSTAITESVKSDINVIEAQIEDFKQDLPTECKNPSVNAKLSTIQKNLNTVKDSVGNIDLSCKTEKEVLVQENSKLKAIILSLLVIAGLLGYILVRKK